jgi:hypothetical protein
MGLPVFQPAAIFRFRPASLRDPLARRLHSIRTHYANTLWREYEWRDGRKYPPPSWRLEPVMRPSSANRQHIVVNPSYARSIYYIGQKPNRNVG